MNITPREIIDTAYREIREEQFRSAVEVEKSRIKAAKWWHKFVPFKILIIRRK